MCCQAPEETLFVLVMPIGTCNAIHPEIVPGQMFNLSGIYLYFLGVFCFPVVKRELCDTELTPSGGYCHELVVQIPLFPCSQGNLIQQLRLKPGRSLLSPRDLDVTLQRERVVFKGRENVWNMSFCLLSQEETP